MKSVFQTLATLSLLISLPLFYSCSDDDDSPSPSNDTTKVDPTPSDPVKDATDKLMANDSVLVVTGDALNITPTSVMIPFRVNYDPEAFSNARIAIIFSDFPDDELNYGQGCQEFYVNPSNFDRFGIAYVTIPDLVPNTKYRYRAYFFFNDKTYAYGEELVFSTTPPYTFSAEAVDLGLSVKWASTNLGATRSYQSGVYYHYGDTTRLAIATSIAQLPKTDIIGTDSDPVSAELPDGWASPTRAQMLELINNCTWVKDIEHGFPGYRVYGINDRAQYYIFIPFAGYINNSGQVAQENTAFMLWSGEQGDDDGKAYCLQLVDGTANSGSVARTNKMWRLPIRPVRK